MGVQVDMSETMSNTKGKKGRSRSNPNSLNEKAAREAERRATIEAVQRIAENEEGLPPADVLKQIWKTVGVSEQFLLVGSPRGRSPVQPYPPNATGSGATMGSSRGYYLYDLNDSDDTTGLPRGRSADKYGPTTNTTMSGATFTDHGTL